MQHQHQPTPSRRARLLGVPLAVLALTLGASACGSDDQAADDQAATDRAGAGESTSAAAGTPTTDPAPAAPAVTVEDPWVRATTGAEDTTMTAAFMLLRNTGTEDATLVSASSPVAKNVQLHEMVMRDGAMTMAEAEAGIVVTAGRGKILEPGGYHVMLMGLRGGLVAGDEVELTLELSDGTTIDVTAPVKKFTEEEGHYHAPGTGEHSH